MRCKNFDERQLLLRGNAFKHGFIILIVCIFFDALFQFSSITEEGYSLVEGKWGHILLIVFAIVVCQIELLLSDAIDLDDKSSTLLFLPLGFIGFLLFISNIYHFLFDDCQLIYMNSLTREGAQFIMSILWLSLGSVYLYKKKHPKYSDEDRITLSNNK